MSFQVNKLAFNMNRDIIMMNLCYLEIMVGIVHIIISYKYSSDIVGIIVYNLIYNFILYFMFSDRYKKLFSSYWTFIINSATKNSFLLKDFYKTIERYKMCEQTFDVAVYMLRYLTAIIVYGYLYYSKSYYSASYLPVLCFKFMFISGKFHVLSKIIMYSIKVDIYKKIYKSAGLLGHCNDITWCVVNLFRTKK